MCIYWVGWMTACEYRTFCLWWHVQFKPHSLIRAKGITNQIKFFIAVTVSFMQPTYQWNETNITRTFFFFFFNWESQFASTPLDIQEMLNSQGFNIYSFSQLANDHEGSLHHTKALIKSKILSMLWPLPMSGASSYVILLPTRCSLDPQTCLHSFENSLFLPHTWIFYSFFLCYNPPAPS